MVVQGFQFTGNKRFSAAELAKVAAPWAGRPDSAEDLEDARVALTRFYVDRGYINSGAVLPDQTVGNNGVVVFQIVEGKLTDIDLTFRDKNGKPANHLLRRHYLISRIRQGADSPLNIIRLKEQLELVRQDPNVRSVNAELRPGDAPGESRLDVKVQEANPFQLGLQFSNRRPPSVGSTAIDLLASDRDLTGNGDLLSLRYDVVNGPLDDLELAGGKDFSIDYAIPITPADTTLSFDFTRTDTVVAGAPFDVLGISSRSDSFSATIRQPVYRQPIAELGKPAIDLDLFASFAIRENHTELGGVPFSFSPGDVNGAEHVTALRFGQEFSARTQEDALTVRTTLSVGVPWFDSTSNQVDNPGGRFVSFLAQAQYVRLLPARIGPLPTENWQLVLRGAGQMADRRLLTLEQFVVGGVDTVRGYPENELVRDQGAVGSLELHIPLIRKQQNDILTFVPFFDVGYAVNKNDASPASRVLDSAGIGFLINPNRHVSAQLYYGLPFREFQREPHDPQNVGIHFNLVIWAL